MNPDFFLSAVIIAGALQGIFLSFVISKKKDSKKTGGMFLVLILLFFSINIILNEILRNIAGINGDFLPAAGSFQFFLGPTVYFYVSSLTSGSYRHKPADVMHMIPAASYLAFMVILHMRDDKMNLLPAFNRITWALIIIQLSAYLHFSRKKITAYDEGLKENFSSTGRLDLNWLNFLFISLLVLLTLYFFLFVILLNNADNVLVSRLMSLFLSVFIYFFGYKGLMQKSPALRMTVKEDGSIKYAGSLLSQEYVEFWKEKLLSFIENDKPYLDPELSLPLLADRLNIHENKLSQIINSGLKTSFYDLINKYRIMEVKSLLSSDKSGNIIELAYRAGFNSKTTFNVIFKKMTGMTPTQYRNSSVIQD